MSSLYEVNDEFEGPAALMGKFISQVKRLGGEVRIEGKRAIITYLPPKPAVEEPVVEEPLAVEEEEVEAVEEEPLVPKRRGRARKVEFETEVETEESE